MSKATKRKHVVKETLEEYVLPDETQEIVKVSAGRGNNLHEVENHSGEKYLVSMPTKFRKNIWIKRGDYVLVQKIEEGDKVKAEISHILYREQIKYIQDQEKWPAGFTEGKNKNSNSVIPDDMLPPSDSDSDNEHLGEMVINTNRPTVAYSEDDSSDPEEEEEDGVEDNEDG